MVQSCYLLAILSLTLLGADAFGVWGTRRQQLTPLKLAEDDWKGDVVPGGQMMGCSIQPVEGTAAEWIITIDGIEADLGKFSAAIYKKITSDAKQQRFQGFRPGTIPPHLLPTYRAFAMDECAREAVLEALEQNSVRPFEAARQEMKITDVSIPPPRPPRKKKGGRKKRKKKTGDEEAPVVEEEAPKEPQWRKFETMKEALDAGWQPGQSFSFIARKVTGQKMRDDEFAKPSNLPLSPLQRQ